MFYNQSYIQLYNSDLHAFSKHHCYEMFPRVICCNISYEIGMAHAQNSESEQKKLPTIFFVQFNL